MCTKFPVQYSFKLVWYAFLRTITAIVHSLRGRSFRCCYCSVASNAKTLHLSVALKTPHIALSIIW